MVILDGLLSYTVLTDLSLGRFFARLLYWPDTGALPLEQSP
jgi:hypothetical protein